MSSTTIEPRFQVRVERTQVRLTRRGRVVLFVLALALAVGLGVFVAAGSVATERPEQTETIRVATGQTLWAIAAERVDGGDVRDVIDHIKRLNGLDSGMLIAGQSLRVPVE